MRRNSMARFGFFLVKRPYHGAQASIHRIRVVLAHDAVLFREGLVRILDREHDIQVVGQAASGEEAAEHCRLLTPDVLITDVALPPAGLEELLLLLGRAQRPRILLLAHRSKVDEVKKTLSSEVDGILADGDGAELARSIRALHPGVGSSPMPYSWTWTR